MGQASNSVGPLLSAGLVLLTAYYVMCKRLSRQRANAHQVSGKSLILATVPVVGDERRKALAYRVLKSVVLVFFAAGALSSLRAETTCQDWAKVTRWEGTYTLTAQGNPSKDDKVFQVSETGSATANMTSNGSACPGTLEWFGDDRDGTGSMEDKQWRWNYCLPDEGLVLRETVIGNTAPQSGSSLFIDVENGTFVFDPSPYVNATFTSYGCEHTTQFDLEWPIMPTTNWPLKFELPISVGALSVLNFRFIAGSIFAGNADVQWTLDFSLTPKFDKTLTVDPKGPGKVTSDDGFIDCPGTCSHSYPDDTEVKLCTTANQGSVFVTWSGACSGNGCCKVKVNGGNGSVGAIFSGPLQFVSVPPCRLVDTRTPNGPFGGPAIEGDSDRSFAIPANPDCNIPSKAEAYSLNVTAVPDQKLRYLTIWPTGENQPFVSTLNSDGRIKANAAIVPAVDNGAVSIFAKDKTDVIVDINGYFVPPSQGTLQFYPLTPCRVADTRLADGDLGGPRLMGGVNRDFPVLESNCNLPPQGVQAYSLNFTAVPHGRLGYLTVCPTPSDPSQNCPVVSTLNALEGKVTANAAIVPAGKDGKIRTFGSDATDLIIDIDGYFAAPGQGGLSLYPTAPCRVIDTRPHSFQFALSPPVDVVGSPCAPPAGSKAYVLNATVVPKGGLDYLTLWPDGGGKPTVSTLNAYDGVVSSNMAIVPAGTGGKVDAFANPKDQGDPNDLTDLILDISSYFAP